MWAIKKYINTNYEVNIVKIAPFIRKGLRKLVKKDVLVQVKGSYKIAKVGEKNPKKEEKKPKKKVKKPKKKVVKKKSEPKEVFIVSQDNMEQEDPLEFNDPKIQKSRENDSKIQKSSEIALTPIVIKEEPIDYDTITSIKTEIDDNFGFEFVDPNLEIKKEDKDV